MRKSGEEPQQALSQQKGPERGRSLVWVEAVTSHCDGSTGARAQGLGEQGQIAARSGSALRTKGRSWTLFWFRRRSFEGFKPGKYGI